MPSDSIISYWKPEVAVRLVTDFSHYPYEYGKGHNYDLNILHILIHLYYALFIQQIYIHLCSCLHIFILTLYYFI